jgi:hypothetical protein
MEFEFVVPKRPVSFQTDNKDNLRVWKDYVYGYAFRAWKGSPIVNEYFRFSIVFLCEEEPPDINNIIKPIEDVLCGLVYPDDSSVISVDGHTRFFSEPFDITIVPEKLLEAFYLGNECVYVKVKTIRHEELFL